MVKNVIGCLGFIPKDGDQGVYYKSYKSCDCSIVVDLINEKIHYPDKLKVHDQTTSNFRNPENIVVLECVDALLEPTTKLWVEVVFSIFERKMQL
jgi:hypothetical protein